VEYQPGLNAILLPFPYFARFRSTGQADRGTGVESSNHETAIPESERAPYVKARSIGIDWLFDTCQSLRAILIKPLHSGEVCYGGEKVMSGEKNLYIYKEHRADAWEIVSNTMSGDSSLINVNQKLRVFVRNEDARSVLNILNFADKMQPFKTHAEIPETKETENLCDPRKSFAELTVEIFAVLSNDKHRLREGDQRLFETAMELAEMAHDREKLLRVEL